ncbi:hypothetical protein [Azospirillum sp. sgz301742]
MVRVLLIPRRPSTAIFCNAYSAQAGRFGAYQSAKNWRIMRVSQRETACSTMQDNPLARPRRWPRPLTYTIRGMVIVTLAVVALLIIAGIAIMLLETPRPPLADNLPTNVAMAKQEFARRVEYRFPIGSNENELIKELSKQGFHPSWRRKDDDNMATVERGGLPCNESWMVTWRSDQAGKIVKINGNFRLTCL